MALLRRMSVYTEHGKTMLGMMTPVKMLSTLSQDGSIAQTAKEVEDKTILMVDEAKWRPATRVACRETPRNKTDKAWVSPNGDFGLWLLV
jgi:hypothetical protein